MPESAQGSTGRARSVALWVSAFILAVAAGAYQRMTGPTYPAHGTAEIAGHPYRYRLPRNGLSTGDLVVSLPTAPGITGGVLRYRRLRSNDDWSTRPLVSHQERWSAAIPRQPAAGKVTYQVLLDTQDGAVTLPTDGPAVTRFKNPVPAWLLIPHILLMFSALLLGVRAGLGAVFAPRGLRGLVYATVGVMTVGGLMLGPLVQRAAFGQLWTGFPVGRDLTDNKTIIMWIVWVVAAVAVTAAGARLRRVRAVTCGAALIMLAVFLIPHSVQGSELDYTTLDQGQTSRMPDTTGG
jgi:hypothetical protein